MEVFVKMEDGRKFNYANILGEITSYVLRNPQKFYEKSNK